MKSIVVFCGSAIGNNSLNGETAYSLGKQMAQLDIRLIYGGAKIGLMGRVADGCLEHGGKVTGVMPEFLNKKEVVHTGLTELITVHTMHERKRIMTDMSEGSITLPGGYGTMEELFELLTAKQLGQYAHPIGLLNIAGYYDALISQLEHMVSEGLTDLYRLCLRNTHQIEETVEY